MARRRKWQSGSADLVSVAVGMVILSIAVTGTAGAMIYGREILNRQEHYKAAAYLLRGEMEKKQWELLGVTNAKLTQNLQPTTQYLELTLPGERGSGGQPIMVQVDQWRIEPVPILELDPIRPAYYIITYEASWEEPEMAGTTANQYQQRKIRYVTAIDVRD